MYNQEISFSSQSLYLSTSINSIGPVSGNSGSSLPASSLPASVPDEPQNSPAGIFDGADQYVSSEMSKESHGLVTTIDTADIASLKAEADKQFEHFKQLVDSFISKQVRSFQFSASFEYTANYSASISSQTSFQSDSAFSGIYDSSAHLNSIPGAAFSSPISFMDSNGFVSINHQEFYQVQETLKIDFSVEAEFDLSIDPATQQEAIDLVSENGEWGALKTSDRIIGFAKALTGGDKSKIDLMKQAFIDGFNQVHKIFGEEMPEISTNTYDLVMQGFDAWQTGSVN